MPVATLVVRLADVAPDGTAAQVAAGILNLTHRESHAEPTALEPGRAYEVRVPMRAAGYRFAPGHRIRLSVASAYWPVLWPSPYPRRAGDPPRDVAARAADDPAGRRLATAPGVQDESGRAGGDRYRDVGTTGLADPGRRHRRHGDGVDQRRRRGPPARRDGRVQRRAARDDRIGRRPGPHADGQRRPLLARPGWPPDRRPGDGRDHLDRDRLPDGLSGSRSISTVVRFFERDQDETIPRRLV